MFKVTMISLLCLLPLQSFSKDFCFKKITKYVDKETGETIRGVYNGDLSETDFSYLIAPSYVRCSCIENAITDSVINFLEESLKYDLSNKQICLKNVEELNGFIEFADGFYIKDRN